MSKPRTHRKPTKHVKQNQNQQPQKIEKQPSWAVVRGLLTCRTVQTQQQQKQPQSQQQQQQQLQPEGKEPKQKQEQRKLQEERIPEESSKKCKKMKCSGSLCNNTKVMARPEIVSPDIHKKRASLVPCSNNDSSSRSMKAPLHELNGAVSATSSSLSASSGSSVSGSFRGMPFRRLSGCYECRMVVDPVLGFTRDPSLRGSICSCPECGEIFMKSESLELHQAVKHAGMSSIEEVSPPCSSDGTMEALKNSRKCQAA